MNDVEPMAHILSDIAGITVVDVAADPDGAFLYAEAQSQVVTVSIFKELADRVLYREGSLALSMRIMDAWDAAPEDKRWNALFMTLQNDRFDARFQYEEGWNAKEFSADRRDRVLAAKYGDKPVDYSEPSATPLEGATALGWSGTIEPDDVD